MGKGTRNRQTRDFDIGFESKTTPKAKKTRKPLSNAAKNIIEYAIVLTLVLAIVAGSLASAGTFKRANILVHSEDGWDLNQQQITYFIWSDIYQQSLQNEYYNAYLQGSSSTSIDYSSMMSTAINTAAGTVQYYLASAIKGDEENDGYGEFMKKFVAVLDQADAEGIELTKEEIKAAKDEATQNIKDMASYFQTTRKNFLKNAIGCNVKMTDIKSMAVMEALYTKVIEHLQAEYQTELDGATDKDAILEKYRDDNKETFYYTEYLSYAPKSDEDKLTEAIEALIAAGDTTVEKFKTVFAEYVFNNQIESSYNKFNAKADADALEVILKDQTAETWEAALDKAIEDKLMTAEDKEISTTEWTNEADLPEDIKTWVFDTARQAYDVKQFDVKDENEKAVSVGVVVYLGAGTENTSAVKIFSMGYEYVNVESDEYKTFKKNALDTILVALELTEKTEEMTLLDEVEADSAEGKIIDELKSAVEKKFQDAKFTDSSNKETLSTEYFDADITENDLKTKPYLDWILTRDAGEIRKFDITETSGKGEDEVTTTTSTYFCIVNKLDYNKDTLVDGGYVAFDTVADAEAFFATLNGKTGADLEAAFTEKSGTVSNSISEDGLNDELKAWLFDSARTEGNCQVVTSGEKAYVAFYNGSAPSWKVTAESNYLDEKLENHITEISATYSVNEKALKRIKDKEIPA